MWQGTRINIVDTPGHADFGGEVERILNMVDGAIVLVDASEGPLPQTKFVVSKALKQGLRPIVAINKIDRPDERHDAVLNEIFDLFANLDATDEQLDFPRALRLGPRRLDGADPGGPQTDLTPLFELVVRHVPPPTVEEGPFRMLATTLEADPYLGRILTGRITSGSIRPNQTIKAMRRDGALIETARVTKVLAFRGLERTAVDLAEAGDIVAIAGITAGDRRRHAVRSRGRDAVPRPADRPADAGHDVPHQRRAVRRPGRRQGAEPRHPRPPAQGGRAQRRHPRHRAARQQGCLRGGRPRRAAARHPDRDHAPRGLRAHRVAPAACCCTQIAATRQKLEPIEEVIIDVDEEHSGIVVQKLSERRADLVEMRPSGGGRQRLVFQAPTRGLIGYQGELLTDTRGTAVMNRLFHGYAPFKGEIAGRRTGVLVSNATGEATAYSLFYLQDRGAMLIDPQTRVYEGMIVGQHTRDNDLDRQRHPGQEAHQHARRRQGRER